MRHDGKSTGLFQEEEEDYNLEEETKYKLKLDTPKSEPAFGGSDGEDESLDAFDDAEGDDLSFGDDKGGDNEKPFDDEPFDAGVEADEDEDPEKYIQQIAGKLGTSLRKYNDERGEPDFDLEKYAINSVISATHTSEMDEEDQKDIIRKVKTSGAEKDDDSLEKDVDTDIDKEEDKLDGGSEEESGFGEESSEEGLDEASIDSSGEINDFDKDNIGDGEGDIDWDTYKAYMSQIESGYKHFVVNLHTGELKGSYNSTEEMYKLRDTNPKLWASIYCDSCDIMDNKGFKAWLDGKYMATDTVDGQRLYHNPVTGEVKPINKTPFDNSNRGFNLGLNEEYNDKLYEESWSDPMTVSEGVEVSEDLKYHLDNKIALGESLFRYGSDSYVKLYTEVKKLNDLNVITLNENDEELIKDFTNQSVIIEGERVLLNLIVEDNGEHILEEGDKYKGKKSNSPTRGASGGKAYKVFVPGCNVKTKSNPRGIKKIQFGSGGLKAKLSNKEAKKSYNARHGCSKGRHNDKCKAGYWSCRLPRYAKKLGLSGGGTWW